MSLKIRSALLPHKHVRFNSSVVGLAGHIRAGLTGPKSLDDLWLELSSEDSAWSGRPTFESIVLAVNVLFAVGEVTLCSNGSIQGAK